MDFKEHAKSYFDFGFNVFPVRDKIPLVSWSAYKSKRQSETELSSLNFNTNTNGIALIGSCSGIRVVDFDDVKDISIVQSFVKGLGFKQDYEWVVKSNRGYHLYFKYDSDFYAKAVNEEENKSTYAFNLKCGGKLELFWANHLITAPPSVHPKGGNYEFVNDKPIEPPRTLINQAKLHDLIKEFCELDTNIRHIGEAPLEPFKIDSGVNLDAVQSAVDSLKNVKYKSYNDWIEVGFALASLGQVGRKYFVDMSLNNSNYKDTKKSLNAKFDELLSNKKGSVSISTLFHYARQYGYKAIDLKKGKSYLDSLLKSEAKYNDMKTKPINFTEPLLKMGEINLIYPKTVNLIQGAFGSHKSRLAEHICSALINKTDESTLGMQTDKEQAKPYLIFIDTEREDEVIAFSMQNILEHSGYNNYDNTSDVLSFTSFIDIPRADRLSALKELLTYKVKKYPNNSIVIVLDVMSDLVKDFNNQNESSEALDFINSLRTNYGVTFICVLHENPGSSFSDRGNPKARGHIGSLVADKSTLICSIGYVKDSKKVIELNFLKSRRNGIPEPLKLKYDETKRCLVYADEIDFEDLQKEKAPIGQVQSNLFALLMPTSEGQIKEVAKGEIVKSLVEIFSCSERTIHSRLSKIEKIDFTDEEKYYLKLENRGRQIFYSLRQK